MKYTQKWMVIPFNPQKTDNKDDTNRKILANRKLTSDDKLSMYNNLIRKKVLNNMPNQLMSEKTPEIYDNKSIKEQESILEADESIKNENDEFQDQNTYDWIKEESMTPFTADLRRFSNMLNNTLKNYNKTSDNITPRNISFSEPHELSLINPINLTSQVNKSNNDLDSTLESEKSIMQRAPAQTTRSKRPISDQTFREITEVSKKKKKKINYIRDLNARPIRKKKTKINLSKYWEAFK